MVIVGDDECPQSRRPDRGVRAQGGERTIPHPRKPAFLESPRTVLGERSNGSRWRRLRHHVVLADRRGGFTGCTQQMINDAYADKANDAGVRFGEIIAAERAKRLATIDEDAAAEQERVEMIEREYMERLERERAAETPDEQSLPQPVDPE